jgi:ATP-dependent DNA helicase RecG
MHSPRPPLLYPLFQDVASLPRVGAAMGKRLEKACGGKRVWDVATHLPSASVRRKRLAWLNLEQNGEMVVVIGTVASHHPARHPHQPYKIKLLLPNQHFITLAYFKGGGDYLEKTYGTGAALAVSGRLEANEFGYTIVHPDYVLPASEVDKIPLDETVYPLTAGITNKQMNWLVRAALEKVPVLPEWLSPTTLTQHGWPSWRDALQTLHHPTSEDNLSAHHPARQRLAYDELLAQQLALNRRRRHHQHQPGRSFAVPGVLAARLKALLPFTLTTGQEKALADIEADMDAPRRMLRLLQGDVGSGKTVLALLAAARVIEAGAQVAILAPTDILAKQHFHTLSPLAERVGLRFGLMTGSDRKRAREETLARLQDGTMHAVIGTHALLEDTVQFQQLGLAVIDEQHRFGVRQRLALSSKGAQTDVLVMTATPIPRTLLLAQAGDMDVTRLTEKPPGRKPITTTVLPAERLPALLERLRVAVAEGVSVYWVCPLVEESEAVDLAAATERYQFLKQMLGETVGLLHGKMKAAEKEAAIAAFTKGDQQVLVATTVIEVGVNVPNASIMVIEHAERFGLAQLHQLRGRVGRGDQLGVCMLLYYPPLGNVSRARLSILRDSNDGFRIAEEDLRLRGAGDIIGTVQSGLPALKFVDWEQHQELLERAHQEAREQFEAIEANDALNTLLHLTGYHQGDALLAAG